MAKMSEVWRERAAEHRRQAKQNTSIIAPAYYLARAADAEAFAEAHAKLEAESSTGAGAVTRQPQTEPSPPEGGSR